MRKTINNKQMISEKEIEIKLRDKVKELGGRAYKFVSPRQCRSS